MQDMRRNVLPKFIEICMEPPCWCPSGWVPTWGRKLIETTVTEFCYKSVNLSLEKLKNIKIIPFFKYKKRSTLGKKEVTLDKMGRTWKMGHTWKYGSHLEEKPSHLSQWVTRSGE